MSESRRFRRTRRLFNRVPEWMRLSIAAAMGLFFFGIGGIIVWALFTPIPSIENFENRQVSQSTKIYDRTGNVVLYDVHGSVRRTSVTLDQISPFIQKAAIATEDDTFYANAGFRPVSFARAVFVNITTGSYTQGGSTITQQVVKNALLTQNKTIARKIEEIILALRLTRTYPKEKFSRRISTRRRTAALSTAYRKRVSTSSASTPKTWTSRKRATSPRFRRRPPTSRPTAVTAPPSTHAPNSYSHA